MNDVRFATTADSLRHELAYAFTPEGHVAFRKMKQRCAAPAGKPTVPDEAAEVCSERPPKLVGKLIEMMTYVLPPRASDDAVGRIFDRYIAMNLWNIGENARTGWQNKNEQGDLVAKAWLRRAAPGKLPGNRDDHHAVARF